MFLIDCSVKLQKIHIRSCCSTFKDIEPQKGKEFNDYFVYLYFDMKIYWQDHLRLRHLWKSFIWNIITWRNGEEEIWSEEHCMSNMKWNEATWDTWRKMTSYLLLYERKLLRIWKTFLGTAQSHVCVIVVFWLTGGEVLWEDTAFQELCSAIMLTKVWLQGCRSQRGKSQWQELYCRNLWNSNWLSLIFKRVLVASGLEKSADRSSGTSKFSLWESTLIFPSHLPDGQRIPPPPPRQGIRQ